jgi:hypothetical protein
MLLTTGILGAILTANVATGTTAFRAYTASLNATAHKTKSIPAFARKYGLRCSACHTAWPELNAFGQAFRDNGYQLGNDRDSPIFKDASYLPIALRITPQWHEESTTNQTVDAVPGDSSVKVARRLTTHGFDLSGMDFWTAGTLYKNISFVLLFSSDPFASFHFESAFIRFDNLANSPWLNVKVGKFELDNLISEKRFLFLSNNGGVYQSYHFVPVGDNTGFGIGDNQLGMELAGHNKNSYTRYSASILSSNDGTPGTPTGNSYDAFFTFSQGFQAGPLGVERIGAYWYLGQQSSLYRTSGGAPIAGSGVDNKSYYRVGLAGDLYAGPIEFLPFYMHARDDPYLGTSTPGNQALPTGAIGPQWNAEFLETHEYLNSRFVLLQRAEIVRMSQQALPGTPTSLGDIDAYSFGGRWMPFMFSRAGLAFHAEYSLTRTVGNVPVSGDGVGLPPLNPTASVWSSSLLFAFDFAF